MNTRVATLRQITDAIATVRDMNDDDREQLHSRAKTMRARNLICTASPRSQGKEIQYSEADIAAAVVAITVSLSGGTQGKIASINRQLRTFGDNQTQGIPAYEDNLELILKGDEPIFIRFDVIALPWQSTRAKMGALGSLGLEKPFEWFDSYQHRNLIAESSLIPVTAVVKPVFASIFGSEG